MQPRKVIAESGVTAYKVAQHTGLTRGALSRYLSGTRMPADVEIAKIELALGVPRGTINERAQEILYAELGEALGFGGEKLKR